MSYRAWWIYWLIIAAWGVIALLVVSARVRLGPAEPLWVAGLALPLVIAGVDLILYRASHERICAVEAREHAWLGALVAAGVLLGAGLLFRA